MRKLPHWTILCISLGAFLLPLLGGHLSIEFGKIHAEDSLLSAILSGEQAPFLTHFLLSLLFFIPLTATLFSRKISHVVNLRITFWLAVFAACIGVSIIVSSFPAVTILNILEWAMMSLAFFAVTLCCGRKQSIFPVGGFLAGSTLAAVLGILEYGQARLSDPGYRIFALQVGPNQAGALFAAGTVLALAMSLRCERLPRLALILSSILQSFALVLTQSKGAIICLPVGIFVLVVGLLMLKPVKASAIIASVILPLLVTGVLAVAAQKASTSPAGVNAISRVTNSGAEASQSAGFRKLLWVSAIDLTKERPYGWGLGTYWYESTRPGKITQTTLAHQTFLQLASEASPLAPISLLAFFGAILVWGARGIRKLSGDSQILLVGVASTLIVAIAHNFVDSDMYIFGLGAFVFLLCGAFTSSSSDSQAPEFIFTLPKIAYGLTALMLIPLCISVGLAEMYRAVARGAMDERNPDSVLSAADSALSVTLADGQAFALRARVSRKEEDFVAAAKLHPSPKFYRALADYYLNAGKYQECFNALNKALERDPNNPSALSKYIDAAIAADNLDLAKEKALKLIATESTTYFTVRSQPEFIPTQTYSARLFLAKQTTDEKEKAKLLDEAVKGFIQYRDITGPVVTRTLKQLPDAVVAGEDRGTLETNYKAAMDACKQLIELQRRLGLSLGFDPAAEADAFAKALGSVTK